MATNLIIIEKGKTKFIHSDEMLSAITKKNKIVNAERASHVDFDNKEQKWQIKGINGGSYGFYPTRKEALNVEVQLLIKNNLEPLQ